MASAEFWRKKRSQLSVPGIKILLLNHNFLIKNTINLINHVYIFFDLAKKVDSEFRD